MQKIATRSSNENDKELQVDAKIITYSHRSNIAIIKYFDDKDVLVFIEELEKIYIKSLLKMIYFHDVTKENIKNTTQTGHNFLFIHTECITYLI